MGRWYALLAGVLGVIGSFVTGSNMSSNILFTDVQVNAAADLGVSSSPLLAAQTARRLRRQYDLPPARSSWAPQPAAYPAKRARYCASRC